jgi:hypothetical protein
MTTSTGCFKEGSGTFSITAEDRGHRHAGLQRRKTGGFLVRLDARGVEKMIHCSTPGLMKGLGGGCREDNAALGEESKEVELKKIMNSYHINYRLKAIIRGMRN